MMLRRKWIQAGIAALVAAGIGIGGYLGYLQASGNFHTVVAGEFYRSAQPNATQLEAYVRQYGIKTIVNLRGDEDRGDWYLDEVATSKRLGIEHVDLEMSASRIVTRKAADRIVAILKDARKPILIHCKAGADRSGIVSAIYSHEIAGLNAETAERQLSIFFGHIGIFYLSSAYAMDESWENLEAGSEKG